MPVTMRDIARDLGLSVVTVSKVLRNHSDISKATRERVLQRVKELRYQPNRAARSLVTGRSFTIGLIVPDLEHPFFGEIAKAIARRIRTLDYSLIIASSEEDPALEQREVDGLIARQVDAIVLASVQTSADCVRLPASLRTSAFLTSWSIGTSRNWRRTTSAWMMRQSDAPRQSIDRVRLPANRPFAWTRRQHRNREAPGIPGNLDPHGDGSSFGLCR